MTGGLHVLGFFATLSGIVAVLYAAYDLISSKDAIYEEDQRAKLTTGVVFLFLGIGLIVIFGENSVICLNSWFGFNINVEPPTHG